MAYQHGTPDPHNGRFDPLAPAGRLAASDGVRPVWPVLTLLVAATLLAWWFLASMAGSVAEANGSGAALGPGMSLIAAYLPVDPGSMAARLANLCLSAGDPELMAAFPGMLRFFALFAMWVAMGTAMMLPMAAPMVRSYAAFGGGHALRGETVVRPVFLVAGYLVLWVAAALGFAAVQYGVALIPGQQVITPLRGIAAGSILLIAGFYQFSSPKHACLEKCRTPVATLSAHSLGRPWDLFRFGIEEGIWSFGCYWALMLVMLVTGSMNVLWMLALTLFTFLEKTSRGRVTSQLGGTIVALWGAALIAGAFIA